MNLVLCGYQASGKTSVGSLFATTYDYDFIDTDTLICQEKSPQINDGYTVREIHQLLGEEKFRQLESEVVRSINCNSNTIIATGGGVLMKADNAQHLKSMAKIIYLYVDPEVLFSRLISRGTLPNFISQSASREDFVRYIESRKDLYESQADKVLNITDQKIAEVVSLVNQYRCEYGQ
jgi:shikimate kinase